ncbi:Plexin-a4-like protein [Gryllus bimaculatus]|nr:Plexin-a4-like protein [Gryllus bimaculatus]
MTLLKLQTIGEDFCGLDVNTPLGGENPMAAVPVLEFGTHLTAVAATSTGDYTVVFLGTSTGHLKKWGRFDASTFHSTKDEFEDDM